MDTLEELKQRMAKFVAARNWEAYHNPKNLVMSIAIEAAELMEIYQWLTPQEASTGSINDPEIRDQLKDEIADVMIYCLSLANATQLDLYKVISDKMDRNDHRFPPDTELN